MTDAAELAEVFARRSALVRAVDDGYVIDVPDPRSTHSYTTVGVSRIGDEWILTDGGITSFLADRDFQVLAPHLECAGVRLSLEEDGHLSTVVPQSSDLAAAVERFAAEASAMGAMVRLLDCATAQRAKAGRPDAVADQMAARTKTHLESRFPVLAARRAVHLRPDVLTGPLHVRPRLAVFRYGSKKAPPDVVCEFLDLRGPQPTRAFSSASSTFVAFRDVAHRFLVADGTASDLDEVRHFVDPLGVEMASTSDYTALDEAIASLV